MAKTRFLIETSIVRTAIEESTAAHGDLFRQATAGGELWTSVYIRKEFIHRWVCHGIRLAVCVAQSKNVSEALVRAEQEFRPRSVKATVAIVAGWLRTVRQLDDPRMAAEEIASVACRWLRRFDKEFPRRVKNTSKCEIGAMSPRVDYDHLLGDLHRFYEEFCTQVVDCGVNGLLGLTRASDNADRVTGDEKAAKLQPVQRLIALQAKKKTVSCRECGKLGDVVIALEQPRDMTLVHVDQAFNDLCRCLGRPHLPIISITAADKK